MRSRSNSPGLAGLYVPGIHPSCLLVGLCILPSLKRGTIISKKNMNVSNIGIQLIERVRHHLPVEAVRLVLSKARHLATAQITKAHWMRLPLISRF